MHIKSTYTFTYTHIHTNALGLICFTVRFNMRSFFFHRHTTRIPAWCPSSHQNIWRRLYVHWMLSMCLTGVMNHTLYIGYSPCKLHSRLLLLINLTKVGNSMCSILLITPYKEAFLFVFLVCVLFIIFKWIEHCYVL